MGRIEDMLTTARKQLAQKNVTAATLVCREIVRSQPKNAEALLMLGFMANETGKPTEAEQWLRQGIAVRPGATEFHYNLGISLVDQRRFAEAEASYRKAISLTPRFAPGYYNLASCLREQGRLDDAVSSLQQACTYDPKLARGFYNLGNGLRDQGRVNLALESFRRALALEPGSRAVNNNFLMALNYVDINPQEILREHRRFGEALMSAAGATRPHANSKDPDRKLRIGILSGDLRQHSCASFLEPVLSKLDPQRLELFCYADQVRDDAVTERFKTYVPNWRNVVELKAPDGAELIRADGIDILIECSGHTEGNRLDIMALKPAPVQMTYLGYPNTTGLSRIDYRLVDIHSDPIGAESLCVERLLRIDPCVWCYRPASNAPEVSPAPFDQNRFITFGSFNNLSKISPATLDMWAEILRRVPSSRLFLKNRWLADPGTWSHLKAAFESRSISADRLEVAPYTAGIPEHLAQYARIDLQLDPYPYHGTTTTCESFWQGVPVLSRTGSVHAARVGFSLLSAVGLPDLAPNSADAYIAKAVDLAEHPEHLAELRRTLRDRMAGSPLRDEAGFAVRLESALRTAWRKWCTS